MAEPGTLRSLLRPQSPSTEQLAYSALPLSHRRGRPLFLPYLPSAGRGSVVRSIGGLRTQMCSVSRSLLEFG